MKIEYPGVPDDISAEKSVCPKDMPRKPFEPDMDNTGAGRN